MMRALRLGLLAFAAIVVGSAASADAAPIKWGYDWSASPSFVTAGGGKVSLSNEKYNNAAGNSHVVATQLKADSIASPQTPDTFTGAEGSYSLTIRLKDSDFGQNGFLTFTGRLQGSFSQLSANVSNTFTGATSQSILLGYTTFVVTMASYTPPGPPDQTNFGSIGATVQVASLKPQEVTPEPSAMALAGLGAGLAGLTAWRRRRRKAA